jgi:hypothetical protein
MEVLVIRQSEALLHVYGDDSGWAMIGNFVFLHLKLTLSMLSP